MKKLEAKVKKTMRESKNPNNCSVLLAGDMNTVPGDPA